MVLAVIQAWAVLSSVRLIATPGTVACQAPLSMEFCRQEYWSGWLLPSPGDLPNSRMHPGLLYSWLILYQLSQHGSLRILEWVAYPLSGGSS